MVKNLNLPLLERCEAGEFNQTPFTEENLTWFAILNAFYIFMRSKLFAYVIICHGLGWAQSICLSVFMPLQKHMKKAALW